MTPIRDELYVGDIQHAARHENYERAGIDTVLSLAHAEPDRPYPESVRVERVPLLDGPQNDLADTRRAVETLHDRLTADETVFVHCSAGASRSVSVAAAGLALREGTETTVGDALDEIADRHPQSHPHPAIVDQVERAVADLRSE